MCDIETGGRPEVITGGLKKKFITNFCALFDKKAERAGYSAKMANVQGYQLLTKANIQEKIQKLKSERSTVD